MKIIVPKYVDLSKINKCIQDLDCEFVHVDKVKEKHIPEGEDSITLETDYFILNKKDGNKFNIAYPFRPMVMKRNCFQWKSPPAVNELLNPNNYPILYFIDNKFNKDSNRMSIHGSVLIHDVVVEYYDEMDVNRFADITKTKKEIKNDIFVVYLGEYTYQCFDVEDLSVSYKFQSNYEPYVASLLSKSKIRKLIEERSTEEIESKPLRKPDFKFVDCNGEIVQEGKEYYLTIYKEHIDEDEDEDQHDNHDDPDIVVLWDYHDDEYLSGSRGLADQTLIVKPKIVNKITYLTCDNKYLYVNLDEFKIKLKDTLPTKGERIMFHLTNNKFKMTMWDRYGYCALAWYKSYGDMTFDVVKTRPADGRDLELLLRPLAF